jgi:cbb3-type cytochrome oxidase maturation protein
MAGRLGHGLEFFVGGVEFVQVIESFLMDILYVLIPLSVFLVLCILAGLWWAIDRGQFEGVDQEGERILRDD